MKVSVLIPYYNRPKQLDRSLWLLRRQTYPDYEVIILDDGSDEYIAEFIASLPFIYVRLRPPFSPPRSPNKAWLYGYTHCSGDFIILSHPELMVPLDAIERIVAGTPPDKRGVPVQYALDWSHRVDSVDWKSDLKLLETLPDFWTTKTPWLYDNAAAPGYRHHFSFTGASRSYWDSFGFLPDVEDHTFQSDDTWFYAQEKERNCLPVPVDMAVYHQYHERVYGEIPQYSERMKRIRKAISGEE